MTPKKGFSLVEMLVVVAIIGILTSIALPGYRKFAARARQASAKSELTSIYTAEQGFHASYRTFTTDWPAMGFIPETMLAQGAGGYAETLDRERSYCSWPGATVAPLPLTLAQLGLVLPFSTMFTWNGKGYPANGNNCTVVGDPTDESGCLNADTAMGSPATTSRDTFKVAAIGCPIRNITTGTTGLDRWTIDENRILKNPNSGI
jgi:prepilin-type N-terminal cleavage/methylation domain-containing protein